MPIGQANSTFLEVFPNGSRLNDFDFRCIILIRGRDRCPATRSPRYLRFRLRQPLQFFPCGSGRSSRVADIQWAPYKSGSRGAAGKYNFSRAWTTDWETSICYGRPLSGPAKRANARSVRQHAGVRRAATGRLRRGTPPSQAGTVRESADYGHGHRMRPAQLYEPQCPLFSDVVHARRQTG